MEEHRDVNVNAKNTTLRTVRIDKESFAAKQEERTGRN